MSEIALYNALTKLGLEHDEAKEAVADVASSKEVATKADLKAGLAELETRIIEKMAEQETRLTRQMYAMAGVIIGAVGGIIAVTGLMIRFLIM